MGGIGEIYNIEDIKHQVQPLIKEQLKLVNYEGPGHKGQRTIQEDGAASINLTFTKVQ